LGYGIFDNGASDIEGHGTERKGLTADEFIKTLETGEKPALVVKEPEKFYGGPDVKVRHYRNRVRFKARGKRKEIRVSAAKARHHGHAAQA
ncbi:MAG TPA: hypothetical protein VN963_05415, partial [bacterium]|nr:hypothetical protein [bacterium]